jgi:glutamyl-tRNA synthetase
MIQAFSLERVGKSGSRFDPEKAKWFNHQYLIKKDDKALCTLFQPLLKEKGFQVTNDFVLNIVGLIKERVNFVKEFWDQSYFFFERPDTYDPQMLKKHWKENTSDVLRLLIDRIGEEEEFNAHHLDKLIKSFVEERQLGVGQIMAPIRLALVGSAIGPGVTVIIELLGKNEVLDRINRAIKTISVN